MQLPRKEPLISVTIKLLGTPHASLEKIHSFDSFTISQPNIKIDTLWPSLSLERVYLQIIKDDNFMSLWKKLAPIHGNA